MNQILTGHFEADGNDVTLPFGFVPDYLLVINSAAVEDEIMKIEWFQSAGVINELHHQVIQNDGVGGEESAIWTAGGEIETIVSASDSPVVGNVTVMGETVSSVTSRMGVTIDASFMDNGDEIYYLAIKTDREVDHGDINA